MNKAVSAKRLLKLADFLETLPRKRFDYRDWVGGDWQGAQDLSCGTTACAMGWAATMPQFRRLGLRISRNGEIIIKGHAFDGIQSAQEIFDLNEYEARYLFTPNQEREFEANLPKLSPLSSATPKQVAKHIRRFVKVCRS